MGVVLGYVFHISIKYMMGTHKKHPEASLSP